MNWNLKASSFEANGDQPILQSDELQDQSGVPYVEFDCNKEVIQDQKVYNPTPHTRSLLDYEHPTVEP